MYTDLLVGRGGGRGMGRVCGAARVHVVTLTVLGTRGNGKYGLVVCVEGVGGRDDAVRRGGVGGVER